MEISFKTIYISRQRLFNIGEELKKWYIFNLV